MRGVGLGEERVIEGGWGVDGGWWMVDGGWLRKQRTERVRCTLCLGIDCSSKSNPEVDDTCFMGECFWFCVKK